MTIKILIIFICIFIVAPFFVWTFIKFVKHIKGYQLWFKIFLRLTFIISFSIALILLIALIILLY